MSVSGDVSTLAVGQHEDAVTGSERRMVVNQWGGGQGPEGHMRFADRHLMSTGRIDAGRGALLAASADGANCVPNQARPAIEGKCEEAQA